MDSIDQILSDLENTPEELLTSLLNAPFELDADFDMAISSVLTSDNIGTPSSLSSEINSDSNDKQSLGSLASPAIFHENETRLTIIAQPYYRGKLRYRSDYDKCRNRLGVLKNRNPQSSYHGPAICIPKCFLDSTVEHYIRVALVTIPYSKTNLRYFHPYDIENPREQQTKDTNNNSVWFSIQDEDRRSGVKSFPLLRIVKKIASDLKNITGLCVFDCQDHNLQNSSVPQCSPSKDLNKEYNLDRSQLAFTVGRKMADNGRDTIELFLESTVFSEEMVEGGDMESSIGSNIQLSTVELDPTVNKCQVYKYAPKHGFDVSNEDMVIFLTRKLEPKKFGELTITFECNWDDQRWSEPINNIDIKDRMISFKTPIFPYACDLPRPVDVILKQHNHVLATLKYYYFSTFNSCSKCQLLAMNNQNSEVPNISTKRPNFHIDHFLFENDAMVPTAINRDESSLCLSVPESSIPYAATSDDGYLPITRTDSTVEDVNDTLITALKKAFISFFSRNDNKFFLRLGRSFIEKQPEILHDALKNNQSSHLIEFIQVARIDILQQKNEHNETFVLYAVRLNRVDVIQALLERKNSEKLIDDMDEKKNNIFHFVALYSKSSEIPDLLIQYLLDKSIPIQAKFDQCNQNHQTPLQLAICEKNLSVTKSIFKHFNTNVHQTKDLTGDNLVHLAVRKGDLTTVKYLIEEGKLLDQGNQSNLTMSPIELAKSLKHDDIVKYLNEKYEIDADDADDDDSSDSA
ncbi:unnamed protein product [Rotaria socialis]